MKYPTVTEFAAAPQSIRDRLHASYIKEPTGCWRWMRSTTTAGYGHFHYLGAYYQAHRFMYSVLRGPITTPQMDHLCRNRWCVNPWHVEPVTAAINSQRRPGNRLGAEKAAAIRQEIANGAGTRPTARKYGVNHSTVSRIANGLIWKQSERATEKEAA